MKKKILFCGEDYGGLKSLFPIFEFLKKKNTCKFFSSVKFKCEITGKSIKPISKYNIKKKTENFNPNLIFFGTSSGKQSIDKILLNYVKDKNIKKIILFEEWYSFKDRLKYRGKQLFGDIYLVNDKIAKSKAINDGLAKEKIFTFCQFHLSNLHYNFKKNFQVKKNQLLFLSENINKKKLRNSMNYPGYSTKEVLDDLVKLNNQRKKKYHILVKKHPSEIQIKNKKKLKSTNIDYIFDYNLLKYLVRSELIVGMRSMGILESIVLEKKCISYQPNSKFERCSAVNLKIIKTLKNFKEFKNIILLNKKYQINFKKFNFIKKIDTLNFKKIL